MLDSWMVDFTMKRWPTKKHQMQKVTKREREGKEVVSSTLDGIERILLRGYIFRLATMDALDALFVHFHEFHMTWSRPRRMRRVRHVHAVLVVR